VPLGYTCRSHGGAAVAEFAVAYADTAEEDYAALATAAREGRVEVIEEEES